MKGLLEQGRIAHRGAGARLRLAREALLAYKARDDQERQAALAELAREAQEQGYGTEPRSQQPSWPLITPAIIYPSPEATPLAA